MRAHGRSAVETAEQLCAVLERIASALVVLDNAALLAAEVTLADLVASFGTDCPPAAADRAAVEAIVRRGRTALLRCRRLGGSFTSVARARLAACAVPDTYTRVGVAADQSAPASTVKATI